MLYFKERERKENEERKKKKEVENYLYQNCEYFELKLNLIMVSLYNEWF